MNLYEAMFVRQTAKNFLMEELDQSILNNIKQFANHLSLLDDEKKPQFRIIDSSKPEYVELSKNGKKAPYYFILILNKQDDYYMNAGYIMGQVSLYCTSKGIGYAYIGEYLNEANQMSDQYVTCLAFGRTKRVVFRDTKKIKKLLQTDNCIYKEELSPDMKIMVQAIKLVPTNLLLQPLRFVIYENRIHIFAKTDTFLSKLKQGIFEIYVGFILSNACLAAEELWLDLSVKRMDNLVEKNLRGHEYLTTILLR